MFDAIEKIFDYLYSGFDIIYNLILSIFRFLQQIPNIMTFFVTIEQYIPTWCLGFIVFSISMSIVLLIAGRK